MEDHVSTDASPRVPAAVLSWVNVRQLVDRATASLTRRMFQQQVELLADVPQYLVVRAEGDQIQRAVFNLLLNALDAMPQGGRVVITACLGARGFELEVADSGPGLSDNVREHLFETCFTTKRGAAGMGLSIVRRIARAHGGEVTAVNCPEGGAAFTVRIPAQASAAAA
ncbi:MAG TPA: ATP-binding protein [Pirellulales bacterium]|jgi:signal transduction histidine kinase